MDTAVEGSTLRGSLALQVGARIRKLRKQRNLTLENLGKLCGTTPQSAQRFETGKATLSLLWIERIAKALEVEPYELLLPDDMHAELRRSARQDLVRLFCQTVEAAYGEEELRR